MMDIIITPANEGVLAIAAFAYIGVAISLFFGFMRFKSSAKNTLSVSIAAAVLFTAHLTGLVFFFHIMLAGTQSHNPLVALSAYAAIVASAHALATTVVFAVTIVRHWPFSRSMYRFLGIDKENTTQATAV